MECTADSSFEICPLCGQTDHGIDWNRGWIIACNKKKQLKSMELMPEEDHTHFKTFWYLRCKINCYCSLVSRKILTHRKIMNPREINSPWNEFLFLIMGNTIPLVHLEEECLSVFCALQYYPLEIFYWGQGKLQYFNIKLMDILNIELWKQRSLNCEVKGL